MADRDQPPPDLRRDSSSKRASACEGGEEPSFEAALDRLEAIVGRLEGGELALEDALAGFEEGVQISRRLAGRLADAERRIERLTREGGGLAVRPLADEGEDTE